MPGYPVSAGEPQVGISSFKIIETGWSFIEEEVDDTEVRLKPVSLFKNLGIPGKILFVELMFWGDGVSKVAATWALIKDLG